MDLSAIIQASDHHNAARAVERAFSGEYAFLQPCYLPAWTVFQSLHHPAILERTWLQLEVENFLAEADRGVFFLEGASGTGKTTFLAQLAYRWGAIHHFAELVPASRSIQIARENLGAQILRAFDMADFMPASCFREAARRKNFLGEVLIECSRRAHQQNPEQKIILVLDGLDEAGTFADLDALGIPESLPKNLFFIISQLPSGKRHTPQHPSRTIYLVEETASHLADLRKFCAQSLESPAYERAKRALGWETLCDLLIEKAKGNWHLLNCLLHLLADMQMSGVSVEELPARLPDHLTQAYLEMFLKIKDSDQAEWYRHLLPLIGALAAYPEPAPLSLLAAYAGMVENDPLLRKTLDQVLQPFLTTDFNGHYLLKHPSLREFLSGRTDYEGLSVPEEVFWQELTENSRQVHLHFAEEILASWGGLEAGLPLLKNLTRLTPRDEYGLEHLVTHLASARSNRQLKQLLNLEWQVEGNERGISRLPLFSKRRVAEMDSARRPTSPVNAWYAVMRAHDRLDSYLDDIRKAWQISKDTGEQVRYALITTSLRVITAQPSSPGTIGDLEQQDQAIARLAIALAEAGESNSALTTAEAISKPHWKIHALAEVANYLPSQSLPVLLRISLTLEDTPEKAHLIANCACRLAELSKPLQALEVAKQIPDAQRRFRVLAQLASTFLEADQVELALEAAHQLKDENLQAELLVDFARYLDRDALQTALSMVKAFRSDEKRGKALAGLAPYLPIALQRDCFLWLQGLREDTRSRLLAILIPHIHEPLLKDAIAAARDIQDESLRAPVLVAVITRLAALGNPSQALKLVPAVVGEQFKAAALSGLSPYLTEEQLYEALGIAQSFKDEVNQAHAQEGLITFLHDPLLEKCLEKALGFKNETSQRSLLRAILKRYLELGEYTRPLNILRRILSQEQRARLLSDLAPSLPENLVHDAFSLALELTSPESLGVALRGLLPRLSHADLGEALATALRLPVQGWLGANWRSEILCKIIPLLAEHHEFDQALAILPEFKEDADLAEALCVLIPRLPDEAQATAFTALKLIQSPAICASALVNLAPFLPEHLHAKALMLLKDFNDEEIRTQTLIGLTPNIPADLFSDLLAIICDLQAKEYRSRALTAAVKRWLQLPVSHSLRFWKQATLSLSNRPRPDFLSDLQALTPILSDLGGVSAIQETLQAIKDVTRWWK